MSSEVRSLLYGLRQLNWVMRSMGLSPSQRAAMSQIMRLTSIIRTCQTLTSGGSLLTAGFRMAGMAGMGQAASWGRAIYRSSKLAGEF